MTELRESALLRDGLFGLLVVVFGFALVRGLTGAATGGGRVAVALVFGVLTAGALGAGIARRVRAPWLAITDESIARVGSGAAEPLRFERAASRDLRFTTIGSFRSRTLSLQQSGTDTVIPLPFFIKARVRDACTAHGWRFD
jgi:hypothetical protein